MRYKNLFNVLSRHLPGKSNPEENQFTDALCYFLDNSKKFRREYLKLIFENIKLKKQKRSYDVEVTAQCSIKDGKAKKGGIKSSKGHRYLDILILDKKNKRFCIVVENKISSYPEVGQLERYKKLIDRKFQEYDDTYVVLFDYEDPREHLGRLTEAKKNKEKLSDAEHKWLKEKDNSIKAWDSLFQRKKAYFVSWHDLADKFPQNEKGNIGYLWSQFSEFARREKQMGSFKGIEKFDEVDNPYSTEKAKEILRAMANAPAIRDAYEKMDLKFRNNPQGDNMSRWDVISPDIKHFTSSPHFTLGINSNNGFSVSLTIPSACGDKFIWERLIGLIDSVGKPKNQLDKLLKSVPELWIKISQIYHPVKDGRRLRRPNLRV